MIGLLARVVIGVVLAGATGAAANGVYKCLTRETAKEDINEKVKDMGILEVAFKAKVTSKEQDENGGTVRMDVMDRWDEPLGDVELHADEISSDIVIGTEIILV